MIVFMVVMAYQKLSVLAHSVQLLQNLFHATVVANFYCMLYNISRMLCQSSMHWGQDLLSFSTMLIICCCLANFST